MEYLLFLPPEVVPTVLNYGPAVLIIFSVFLGILLNRRDVNALREDMRRQFDEVNRRLTLIETDQKQFFTITGRLDGRINEIARR